MRVLVLLGIFCFLNAASLHTTKYDEQIKFAVSSYWQDFPKWKMYKAQLYQESLFELNATSPVGAMGIAQFMPRTWIDISKRMKMPSWANAYMPRYAIDAGAYYMRILRNAWSAKRSISEKHRLALASYNAGLGNILKAQKLCGNAIYWDEIKRCLKQVTGKNSKETILYIERIEKWHSGLN